MMGEGAGGCTSPFCTLGRHKERMLWKSASDWKSRGTFSLAGGDGGGEREMAKRPVSSSSSISAYPNVLIL